MCGILGVVAKNPVNQLLYDGLLVLQHRGRMLRLLTEEGDVFISKGGWYGARRVSHPETSRAGRPCRHCTTRYPPAVRRGLGEHSRSKSIRPSESCWAHATTKPKR